MWWKLYTKKLFIWENDILSHRRPVRMQSSTNAVVLRSAAVTRHHAVELYLRPLVIRVDCSRAACRAHLRPVIPSRRNRRPRDSCETLNRISAAGDAPHLRCSASDAESVASSRDTSILFWTEYSLPSARRRTIISCELWSIDILRCAAYDKSVVFIRVDTTYTFNTALDTAVCPVTSFVPCNVIKCKFCYGF